MLKKLLFVTLAILSASASVSAQAGPTSHSPHTPPLSCWGNWVKTGVNTWTWDESAPPALSSPHKEQAKNEPSPAPQEPVANEVLTQAGPTTHNPHTPPLSYWGNWVKTGVNTWTWDESAPPALTSPHEVKVKTGQTPVVKEPATGLSKMEAPSAFNRKNWIPTEVGDPAFFAGSRYGDFFWPW